MTTARLARRADPLRGLLVAAAINLVWINASEVARYFGLVMPMMRAALSEAPNVAPMNLPVFLVWGLWDTIVQAAVIGFTWLLLEKIGYGVRNALAAGAMVWAAVFGVLWLGVFNMNLATPKILLAALPWALVEMCIASLVVNWSMTRVADAP